MKNLDVPELLEIPAPAPFDFSAVAVADFLTTSLLRRLPAMLMAEFDEVGRGQWFVRDAERRNTCVFESKSVNEFRTVLARFGFHYMGGQLYGGHIRRSVTQNGRTYACEIFMSNQQRTGFWIRVYAHKIGG